MKLYHSQSISINFNQLSLILFLCIYSSGYYAQNNSNNGQGVTQWKTNGNIADSNHYIGTKNEFPVKFRTNDTERLRITSDGNIGVGTANPLTKFHVNGGTTLEGLLKLPLIDFANPSNLNQNNFNILILNNLDNSVNKIDQLNFQKLLINLNYATLPLEAFSECDIQSANGLSVNGRWLNGPSKLFTNCPEVKVGINNDNPRVHLDVNGTSYSNFLSLGGDPTIMGNDLVRFRIKGYSINNNSNLFEINNNSNLLLSISNQGNLNLNGKLLITSLNNNPFIIQNNTEKLLQVDSDGLLRARRVKIDQDSWADYVFEDEFTLMSIYEVEEYITKNNRLPDVPSTAEVKVNGVDIAEMNALLLKKIEELMLYTIDQQKEIDLLNKKVEDLENN